MYMYTDQQDQPPLSSSPLIPYIFYFLTTSPIVKSLNSLHFLLSHNRIKFPEKISMNTTNLSVVITKLTEGKTKAVLGACLMVCT